MRNHLNIDKGSATKSQDDRRGSERDTIEKESDAKITIAKHEIMDIKSEFGEVVALSEKARNLKDETNEMPEVFKDCMLTTQVDLDKILENIVFSNLKASVTMLKLYLKQQTHNLKVIKTYQQKQFDAFAKKCVLSKSFSSDDLCSHL